MRFQPLFLDFMPKFLLKLLLLKALLESLQLELSVFSVNVVCSLLHKNPQRRGGSCAAGGQRAIGGKSDALKSLERQLGNEADRS